MFSTLGRYMSTVGGYHEYTRGYHEYSGGIPWVHRGVFSTPEVYHDECGDIMSTLGDVQYTGGIPWVHWGDTISTPGILVWMGKSHYRISRIFVLAPFATMQLYMLASGTSDSLLKFLYQVARAQTLTHFLFHLWSKVFSFKMSSRYVARWMKTCAAFTASSKRA